MEQYGKTVAILTTVGFHVPLMKSCCVWGVNEKAYYGVICSCRQHCFVAGPGFCCANDLSSPRRYCQWHQDLQFN